MNYYGAGALSYNRGPVLMGGSFALVLSERVR